MLKRDRTPEEKKIDVLTRRAILSLGKQPSHEAAKNPFPYYLSWDRLGRKGRSCRILKQGTRTVQIEFEDGMQHIIDRRALRRRE